jgi:hypothetical protein
MNLTDEQKEWICSYIGDWYLKWKERKIGENFGFAKEELKEMICEGRRYPDSVSTVEDFIKLQLVTGKNVEELMEPLSLNQETEVESDEGH